MWLQYCSRWNIDSLFSCTAQPRNDTENRSTPKPYRHTRFSKRPNRAILKASLGWQINQSSSCQSLFFAHHRSPCVFFSMIGTDRTKRHGIDVAGAKRRTVASLGGGCYVKLKLIELCARHNILLWIEARKLNKKHTNTFWRRFGLWLAQGIIFPEQKGTWSRIEWKRIPNVIIRWTDVTHGCGTSIGECRILVARDILLKLNKKWSPGRLGTSSGRT